MTGTSRRGSAAELQDGAMGRERSAPRLEGHAGTLLVQVQPEHVPQERVPQSVGGILPPRPRGRELHAQVERQR
eukprot:CAMPEP_0172558432 /NCGR_PEP_ID=MMETSP1067-20121228/79099_1 /TAXON_ID=265564 ORGANISM="Thalassiosira punctigera, Strain Tpunct2005C2" /NCGR_SAMPLE_ID=MMETSP1067 /ASSEMBLY_ACC=CAM_ASM_000444 /LENGTH=73 /DNA_ID=CAMNT_0013347795 /DNA_START=42 /DNA_END=260 /DNA_ORIENTATION=-